MSRQSARSKARWRGAASGPDRRPTGPAGSVGPRTGSPDDLRPSLGSPSEPMSSRGAAKRQMRATGEPVRRIRSLGDPKPRESTFEKPVVVPQVHWMNVDEGRPASRPVRERERATTFVADGRGWEGGAEHRKRAHPQVRERGAEGPNAPSVVQARQPEVPPRHESERTPALTGGGPPCLYRKNAAR
jgi:hypothetical protein